MSRMVEKENSRFIQLRYYDRLEKKYFQFSTGIPKTKEGKILFKEFQRRFDAGLLEKEIKEMRGIRLKTVPMKVSEGFELYLKEAKERADDPISESSEESYRQSLDHWINCNGDKPIRQYSREHFGDFIEYLSNYQYNTVKKKGAEPVYKTMAIPTVAKHTRQIKVIFNYFMESEYLPTFKIPTKKAPKADPQSIPLKELQVILAELESRKETIHQFYFAKFALLTGARASTCLSLDWSTVYIHRGYTTLFNVKTGKYYPFPIHRDLEELLLRMQGEKMKRIGRVFPQYAIDGSTPHFWAVLVRRLYTEEKISELYTFHQLRKTFATWLANEGVDTAVVQALLNHSDISVTAEFYTEKNMKVYKGFIEKVNFG